MLEAKFIYFLLFPFMKIVPTVTTTMTREEQAIYTDKSG